jgi:hypothetical protein
MHMYTCLIQTRHEYPWNIGKVGQQLYPSLSFIISISTLPTCNITLAMLDHLPTKHVRKWLSRSMILVRYFAYPSCKAYNITSHDKFGEWKTYNYSSCLTLWVCSMETNGFGLCYVALWIQDRTLHLTTSWPSSLTKENCDPKVKLHTWLAYIWYMNNFSQSFNTKITNILLHY